MLSPAVLGPTDASRAASFDAAAAAAPLPFDPSQEYRRLLEAAEPKRRAKKDGESLGKPDAYQYLMSRERRVLDTVDRVVNDSITKEDTERSLLGMPVHELAMRTIGAVRSLLDDLIAARSVEDGRQAILDHGRMPFLGIALVALAVFMGMVHLAS